MPLPHRIKENHPWITPKILDLLGDLDQEGTLVAGEAVDTLWHNIPTHNYDHAQELLQGSTPDRKARAKVYEDRQAQAIDDVKRGEDADTDMAVDTLKALVGDQKTSSIVDAVFDLKKQHYQQRSP